MNRNDDGYEELPSGDAPGGPTFTQPGGAAQPPPPAQQPQFARGQAPLEGLPQLPPSAAEEWDAAAVVMSVWLGCAAATLLLSMISGNFFGTMGSTCALVGACTHRFPACRGGADLAACITRCHTLAVVAASLCGIIAALSTLIAFGLSAACTPEEDPKGCAAITEITLVYALWYTFFTILCSAVARRMKRTRLLLDPVSSGLVRV